MEKKVCLVLFGGRSSEHDVSCMSVQNIMKNIDTDLYEIAAIGITKEGEWLLVPGIENIADGSWTQVGVKAVLSPSTKSHGFYAVENGEWKLQHVDVCFPVLHGLNGEDGTVQGLLELAGIPYVGCGVLSSAVTMDKVYTKIVVDELGIRQASHVTIHRNDLKNMEACVAKVEEKLPYPVFVKPSCAGSSVGVNQAKNREGLMYALTEAAKHDAKILVEETITGRELECAVLGNDETLHVSGIGEVLAAAEFYDYEAKYHNAESKTVISPELPEGVAEEIRKDAELIFRAVGGHSFSRVDFFLDEKGVVFNEINTIPGFTAISMYPMLIEASGIEKKALIQRLLETAFERREH